jgi:hypothetical protein
VDHEVGLHGMAVWWTDDSLQYSCSCDWYPCTGATYPHGM